MVTGCPDVLWKEGRKIEACQLDSADTRVPHTKIFTVWQRLTNYFPFLPSKAIAIKHFGFSTNWNYINWLIVKTLLQYWYSHLIHKQLLLCCLSSDFSHYSCRLQQIAFPFLVALSKHHKVTMLYRIEQSCYGIIYGSAKILIMEVCDMKTEYTFFFFFLDNK